MLIGLVAAGCNRASEKGGPKSAASSTSEATVDSPQQTTTTETGNGAAVTESTDSNKSQSSGTAIGAESGDSKSATLPPVSPAGSGTDEMLSLNGPGGTEAPTATESETPAASRWDRGPSPEDIAEKAFLPPPGGTSLSKDGRLWIDAKRKRVYIDGYVAMTRGPLEMFACPVGTKEHESIVAALSRSRDVHAALLAIEATPGTPVRFRPTFVPPTGQVIRVWVCWYDKDGKFQAVDAREWIHDLDIDGPMKTEWVFAGSGFWQDPEDKREYYEADGGDMICVSNFSSAMLDVAISSSADADSLRFEPFETKIPPRDTPVRLVLVPVPNPTDDDDAQAKPSDQSAPESGDVPRANQSANTPSPSTQS
ncbi:hypothetical protein CGZ80_16780 [Rhodopirellula sp. MGV]|nr:hypothetical protein CGZ80_16780 [Rhodopirellula sp. MGV]PNY38309.1 hypothetical protein C2E31_03070 [Rhodopirellula baltica]